ncbi:HNH endonuclease [Citrobacter freundii]|uniref:HNH endonuclease n=1 Tax=Citrobacter freundii TaxID=546 RepID=UPI0015E9C608|nr:HNH endonuclease signature motif containing protein [Citrobacter freundii]QLR75956.1 HNH endonuclease [Citrobacter freundii]
MAKSKKIKNKALLGEVIATLKATDIPQIQNVINQFIQLNDAQKIVTIVRENPYFQALMRVQASPEMYTSNREKYLKDARAKPFKEKATQIMRRWYPNAAKRAEGLPQQLIKTYFPREYKKPQPSLSKEQARLKAERDRINAERERIKDENKEAQLKVLSQYRQMPKDPITATRNAQTELIHSASLPVEQVDIFKIDPAAVHLSEQWKQSAEERRRDEENRRHNEQLTLNAKEIKRRALVMSNLDIVKEHIAIERMQSFRDFVYSKMQSDSDAKQVWGVMRFVEAYLKKHGLIAKNAAVTSVESAVKTSVPLAYVESSFAIAAPEQSLPRELVKLTAEGSKRLVHQRDGTAQASFRRRMFSLWGGKCGIERIPLAGVLEAAHIVHGTNYNDDNGILMTPTMHALFDLHLIGIEPNTLIVRVSPDIPELSKYDGMTLIAPVKLDPDGLKTRWADFNKRLKQ